MIPQNQTVSEGNYLRFVANAANLPYDFLTAHAGRISLAYKMGERPEMIAEELRLRYSLQRPTPTKTPRALASRVVLVSISTENTSEADVLPSPNSVF